jgi:hypothetical protein
MSVYGATIRNLLAARLPIAIDGSGSPAEPVPGAESIARVLRAQYRRDEIGPRHVVTTYNEGVRRMLDPDQVGDSAVRLAARAGGIVRAFATRMAITHRSPGGLVRISSGISRSDQAALATRGAEKLVKLRTAFG